MKETVEFANDNMERSRQQQKRQYDKRTKDSNIHVNDHVLLWNPYHKRNISKCFLPKWKGPWMVVQLTGPSNCKIVSEKGEFKHVNVDQLKKVVKRDVQFPSRSAKANVEYTDVFEDEVVGETTYSNDTWCGVNDSNILPTRMRSGNVVGGV